MGFIAIPVRNYIKLTIDGIPFYLLRDLNNIQWQNFNKIDGNYNANMARTPGFITDKFALISYLRGVCYLEIWTGLLN